MKTNTYFFIKRQVSGGIPIYRMPEEKSNQLPIFLTPNILFQNISISCIVFKKIILCVIATFCIVGLLLLTLYPRYFYSIQSVYTVEVLVPSLL